MHNFYVNNLGLAYLGSKMVGHDIVVLGEIGEIGAWRKHLVGSCNKRNRK